MALTAEVGELVEVLQWLTPEEAEQAGSDASLRPRLEDEMADVLIYLTSLAKVLDVDLIDVALAKVARNDIRFPADL
jgi:NTP pyrophosphatase (non-canonical NTP hydrolase)